jgi:hypothetical protein
MVALGVYGSSLAMSANGMDRPCTWRVGDDDRLCIHVKGDEELCRGVIEIDGVTIKFVRTRSGKTKIVVTFKSFRAGGPGDI